LNDNNLITGQAHMLLAYAIHRLKCYAWNQRCLYQ